MIADQAPVRPAGQGGIAPKARIQGGLVPPGRRGLPPQAAHIPQNMPAPEEYRTRVSSWERDKYIINY